MIDEVLSLLRNKLNRYFRTQTQLQEDKAVFLAGENTDPIVFPLNNVVPLLINIEEEKMLRPANRYQEHYDHATGVRTGKHPPISINLFVLFVCRFSAYEQSLKFLSHIMQFFQQNLTLDGENCPELKDHPEIQQLRMELVTMSLSQQNELWNSLKTQYHPSALYKVGILVFRDRGEDAVTPVTVREIRTTSLATDSLSNKEPEVQIAVSQ
ncbi:DUF4255 domain-containing protein [Hymenobacter convexus]|uniref:DUF4255 domain-containing protein n=1 Tax=Hymenobacter sp. CA1UV-4 TaxID=3063782 RepID=UPI002713B598|nr:DUF4255 domain-containing protein [Hymenobacter sp. CA1UV-4]MDO7854095.1 DUF4255 domain-containing protein [Hymenobacter sp. CA1UV-4]